ncbi:unnamed protein product [Ceutorhynchus assimilis]|uniref:Protein ELYS n=1 Tax=Ceutorhynchus assimilis TaxID=467358 RepID=A0A9N9QRH9_9CUCU|nr:unnamed protein product [Ceutorhynchus assimilis]
MSFQLLTAVEKFQQKPFQFKPYLSEEDAEAFEDFPVLGNILSDLKYFWQAKGPCLEVRLTTTGCIVGSYTFGSVLKDTNTKIVAVEELKRRDDPLLVVALDCALTGGVICVFDIFGRGVLRAVRIGEKISNIHVIAHGCETVFPESSPLQYFDGLLAVGTVGGSVFLLDLCKQICENVLNNNYGRLVVRGELNNCQMNVLNKQNIHNIKKCIEISVEREEHLAIHLNAVLNFSSRHFTLKGEEGDDRVHVNKEEAEVSAFFYAKQIASLFIGYNFGSFQMWDLCSLDLLYTSPLCEPIIPITNFTIQEPADDPKSVCYIWVSFSHNLLYGSELPYAVMYAFYFKSKTCVDKYGSLYEDFQHCSIRFQLALGDTRSASVRSSVKGGICLGLQSINENVPSKDQSSLELCLISWLFWDKDKIANTAVLIFDLNQWYKAQMPATPNWLHCSNYIIKNSMDKKMISIKMNRESLRQFMGIQRPEEHFCPTSLSFNLCAISEHSVFKIENECHQKLFLSKVLNDQHLALVNPVNFAEEIINLGLTPLFYDIHNSQNGDYQRELLLNVMLEQDQLDWLFEVASELANNAFSSAGLTLYNMIRWAFQRAVKMKISCDKYCQPLFDYSGIKLDKNILHLISCGKYQISNLCNFYKYISSELWEFVADKDGFLEEQRSLDNVVQYFEVLLWMVGAGLLPEFQAKSGTRSLSGVPYLVQDLTDLYDQKRAQLRLGNKYTFVGNDCLIFIDNMINSSANVDVLRQIWQNDGGSGLYPPPSLQSLLRTYLLDGPDLVFKHFLVTYTLLDIAMTLDKDNKVIELLIKFPENFDLSKSNIKIIQGFWNLDHGNYETALDCLLDESIRPGDLEPWHHSVMIKTLLMQNKSSLAVRYLQDRNPAIHEEKDLLTVISILVSKNLLDDAFEFRLRHRDKDDCVLLNHIFNECNRNDTLEPLLCRSFTPHEEQAFLKYLQNTRDPKCEELRIFYYLLRSRFLDAFDAYDLDKRHKPDTQGLVGQKEASAADNLVQMYKSLMPDVYSQLIELVRKERTNLWIDVPNPQPMSVFVHNARENVKYKSSYLFAALAKAKQSFENKTNEIVTEEIPFLRTLVVPRNKTNESIPVIKFKPVGDYSRKRKLSPQASKSSPKKPRNMSLSIIQSQLESPIVGRDKRRTLDNNDTAFLPQSILKSSTILENSFFNENLSPRRSALGLSPRSSVKSITKSHVQFSDVDNSGVESGTKSSVETSGDDVFYSPEHSFDERNQDDVEAASKTSIHQSKEKLNFDDSLAVVEQASSQTISEVVMSDTNPIAPVEENIAITRRFESPKCRRSLRSNTSSPIRSSPRLAKKSSEEKSSPSKSISNENKPSPSVQKLRGRHSLSRAVLENNLLKSQNLLLEETYNDSKKLQLSCSSISDMSFNDSSLLAFLEEDQSAQDSDTSFETENVEIVSKVTEISRTEIHRENLRLGETGNIVTTKETKEEFHLRTVEEFKDEDDLQEKIVKETVDKQEEKIVEEIVDKQEEKIVEETVDEQEEKSLEEPSKSEDKDEALNIYDDLSSASEDGKEALENVIKEKLMTEEEVSQMLENPANENDIEMIIVPEAHLVVDELIDIYSSSDEGPTDNWSSDNESLNVSAKQNLEDESSNQSSESEQKSEVCDEEISQQNSPEQEYISDNSEDFNETEKSSTDNSYDSNAPIVKHVVGDDDDDSNSQHIEKEVLEQARSETPVEDEQQNNVEENPNNSSDSMDSDSSEKDENSDVDESSFDERVVTPTRGVSQAETDSSNDSQMSEKSLETPTSPQDVASSPESSEASEKQSRGIQCTLAMNAFEKPIGDESDVEEQNSVKESTSGRASTDEDVVASENEEPKSIGLQCSFGTPNVKEECVEPTTIKVKTVKRTYKGRKGSMDVDATPKLAVSLPIRTYSKKLNVRLFEKNVEDNVTVEENVAHDTDKDVEENNENVEEIVHIDEDIGENVVVVQEDIIDTDINKEVVVHEEIVNMEDQEVEKPTDKDVEEINKDVVVQEEIVNIEDQELEKHTDKNVEEINKDVVVQEEIVNIEDQEIEKDDVKLDSAKEIIDTDKQDNISPSLEVIKQTDATPIRMTRRRSMLMSQESSEFSEKTNEKDDLSTSKPHSTTSSQSSDCRRSQRFMKFAQEKPDNRDNSPLRESLVEKKVEILKTKEGTPKQKTTNKRASKKILSDIDAHVSIDSDLEAKPQSTDLAKSTNVYAKRTTKTSKTRATSVASVEPTKKPGTKRTRSLSTDQPATRKRNTRTKSVDLQNLNTDSHYLKIVLTPFDIKASTSRKKSSDMQKLPPVEEIDPLTLLNKAEFCGPKDPEEAKVYQEDVSLPPSPVSLRQTRSTSVLSNASSIKSRLRRASADTVSESSDPPSPPKRHKKKEVEESSAKSVPYTRSRSNSVSSLRSDTTSTRNTRARSRLPSVLEDIQEEKKSDEEKEGAEKSNVRKRGRKRK